MHPLLLLPEKDRQILEGLRGFWVGTYGSHGQEIIQVRFTTTAAATMTTMMMSSSSATVAAPPAVAAPAVPAVIMEGLKIVSHAKVPANEWSFRVDVSCGPLDMAGILHADPRPVYTVDKHYVLTRRNLLQETGRIHAVYRGKGQINASRKVWAPQEVGVDLVVLRPEEKGMGGLWVVWHDEGWTSRHCVDLIRLVVKDGEEEQEEEEKDDDEW